jgi:hypothetical protein
VLMSRRAHELGPSVLGPRDGVGRVLGPHRFALAAALDGRELPGSVLARRECDNPPCVRSSIRRWRQPARCRLW